jgi:hypothetical protein
MQQFISLLLFFCVLTACTTHPPVTSPRVAHLDGSKVSSYFSAHPAGVTFVSGNGHMYGTDSDARITMKADHEVELTEYSDAVGTWHGTYSVDVTGAIRVSLRHYPGRWPALYLRRDRQGVILFPNDQDPSFRVGGRAGAVETPGMDSFWSFRQVN